MKIRNSFMIKSIIFCITIAFIFSCEKASRKSEELVSISKITTNYDSLIYGVIVEGDTNAYDELYYGFMDANKIERTDSVLRYAKIMAEKFQYERAYFDYLRAFLEKRNVDSDLSQISKLDLTKLNDTSKVSVIKWLHKMKNSNVITLEEFNSIKK